MGPYLAIPLAIVLLLYFWRVRDPQRRARFLCLTGLVLTGLVSIFLAALLVGETLDDPGGRRGATLIAIWLAPLILLATATWLWPNQMVGPLTVLAAASITLALWFAMDTAWWRQYEDQHGPIRTVVMFVIATAISLLGWARPLLAGTLLIGATAIPMLITQVAMGVPLFSLDTALANIGAPYVMVAFLYLIAASVSGRGRQGDPTTKRGSSATQREISLR